MTQVLYSGLQVTSGIQSTASLSIALQESDGISAGVFFLILLVLVLLFLALIWIMQRRSENGRTNGDSGGAAYPGTTVAVDAAEDETQAEVVGESEDPAAV